MLIVECVLNSTVKINNALAMHTVKILFLVHVPELSSSNDATTSVSVMLLPLGPCADHQKCHWVIINAPTCIFGHSESHFWCVYVS